MRNCFFLPVFLLMGSSSVGFNWCEQPASVPVKQKSHHSITSTHAGTWIEDFRKLRDALYKNDTVSVKSFFKLPLLNNSNDIWYLVLTEKELDKKKINATRITPFTEKDFHHYYKKIFPAAFLKCLLTIKTGQLYKQGAAESVTVKEGNTTTVKLYASFDKKGQLFTLNTAYNTVFKDEDGQVMDGGESNVIYTFRVLNNGHLQFLYLALAG